MTRVGIAGPDGVLRAGLEALLRSDPDVQVTYVADGPDQATAADVLVALDADLDALSLREDLTGIVVLTAQPSAEFVRAALRLGVRSVLPHDCSASELRAAVEAAVSGLVALRAGDVESLLLNPQEAPAVTGDRVLSPREAEVLRLLADGLANKEIGYRLGISEHTVKFHVNSILTRLDVSSRAEAVAVGMRRGLILL
jgi:DNA-binding NarL/FixJ family response regulator